VVVSKTPRYVEEARHWTWRARRENIASSNDEAEVWMSTGEGWRKLELRAGTGPGAAASVAAPPVIKAR